MTNGNELRNAIGIEQEQAEQLSQKLNDLLANYQVFYQNLRGFHWNISGPSFFELHAKFEELYNRANESVDEIAERILTLGGQPLHTFEDYLSRASIQPARDQRTANETVSITVSNFSTLLQLEREILALAGDAEDEGTVTLMSDNITEQEKVVWMLNAYLQ